MSYNSMDVMFASLLSKQDPGKAVYLAAKTAIAGEPYLHLREIQDCVGSFTGLSEDKVSAETTDALKLLVLDGVIDFTPQGEAFPAEA